MKVLRVFPLLGAIALVGCQAGSSPAPTQPAATAGSSSPPSAAATSAPPSFAGTTLKFSDAGGADFAKVGRYRWEQQLKEKYGITVEEVTFEDAVSGYRALVADEVTLGGGATAPLIRLVAAGEDVKAIGCDLGTDYLLMAQADIKTPKDLEGKKVGISTPGDVSDTLTRVVLKRSNVNVDSIEFVQIGGTSSRVAALLANQISGGAAHVAAGYAAIEKSNGSLHNVLSYGPLVPNYTGGCVSAKGSWITANPQLAQVVVNELLDAQRWAADNKDEYIELSKQFVEGLSDQIRSDSYDVLKASNYWGVNGGFDPKDLQTTVELEQELGNLAEGDVAPIESWTAQNFVNAYLTANGTR